MIAKFAFAKKFREGLFVEAGVRQPNDVKNFLPPSHKESDEKHRGVRFNVVVRALTSEK